MENASTTGPLNGYRVLELCSTIAGPACTRLLADFGAEVIKVEPPEGDAVRKFGIPDQGVSLYASSILRNKHTVSIDLKSRRGHELILELAGKCDVVVENFRPGTLERLGLGYDVLRDINPGLVLVRISGYGQTGPYRDKAGYGAICEAFGGIRELTGEPDRPPPRVAVAATDYLASVYAAFGAVTALLERKRTGAGQVVDAALYEAAFTMMEASVPAYDRFDYIPTREGSRLPYMAPNNLYLASDGSYVLIAANNNKVFARLAEAMERPDLCEDPRYASIEKRWEHVDEIDAEIQAWTGELASEEIQRRLEAAGVPMSRVNKLDDIFREPHYRERDMLLDVPHPKLDSLTQVGIVPKLSRTPGRVSWAGHDVGQDTRQVLAELLQLDEEALQGLEASDTVRCADGPNRSVPKAKKSGNRS